MLSKIVRGTRGIYLALEVTQLIDFKSPSLEQLHIVCSSILKVDPSFVKDLGNYRWMPLTGDLSVGVSSIE